MGTRLLLVLMVVLALTGGRPLQAQAAGSGLAPVTLSSQEGRIHVSTLLEGGFPAKVIEELQEGISREFYYYFVLYRVIPFWYDAEKTSQTIRFTVKYNRLKGQFSVTRSAGLDTLHRDFDSFQEMEGWVSRVSHLSLVSIQSLSQQHRYYVSARAEMKAGEPPLILKYVLYFVPYSTFSTPWVRSQTFRKMDLKS